MAFRPFRVIERGVFLGNAYGMCVPLIWVFPKIGGKPPKLDGFTMEYPIKMDDLGVALFLETPISLWEGCDHQSEGVIFVVVGM